MRNDWNCLAVAGWLCTTLLETACINICGHGLSTLQIDWDDVAHGSLSANAYFGVG